MAMAAETVTLLSQHKVHQAGLKFADRDHYHNHDFVFAKG
jgi:hypothetical protein